LDDLNPALLKQLELANHRRGAGGVVQIENVQAEHLRGYRREIQRLRLLSVSWW
jgi:hypothetical protein